MGFRCFSRKPPLPSWIHLRLSVSLSLNQHLFLGHDIRFSQELLATKPRSLAHETTVSKSVFRLSLSLCRKGDVTASGRAPNRRSRPKSAQLLPTRDVAAWTFHDCWRAEQKDSVGRRDKQIRFNPSAQRETQQRKKNKFQTVWDFKTTRIWKNEKICEESNV